MTLNLTPRRDAMLQEMGIVMFAPKPASRLPRPLPRTAQTLERASKVLAPAKTTLADPSPPKDLVTTQARRAPSAPLASSSMETPATHPLPNLNSLSWNELSACVFTCQQCPLGSKAPARHFGSLPLSPQASEPPTDLAPKASWLVVSDAPKVDLEQHAQAFSSNSLPLFQQFFKALDSCGPEPSDWSQRVYLTTALKCVPLQHEDALSPQSAVCLTFLREQIRRLKPKVIVVMGRVAAQLLLAGAPEQQLPLGRLRGKVLSFEDTPMLVTFSPEFLLHAQADKALCWEDLCLAQSIEAQTA